MGLSSGVVVLIAIICAAAAVAVGAAMHRVYSQQQKGTQDSYVAQISNDQTSYMRDVRIRSQLNAWGKAPTFAQSQVGYDDRSAV